MRITLAGLCLLATTAAASANELVYEGTWVTTNRKLDGTLASVVTKIGDNKWQGNFTGEWQGLPFSYTVEFSGPPDKLSGTAVVDGARYRWTGSIGKQSFKGSFDGDRYIGSFEMKRKKPPDK